MWLAGAVLVGGGVGVVSAMFGIGGGTIYVPMVFMLLEGGGVGEDAAVKTAIGTSLFVMSFMSVAAGWGHYREGNRVSGAALPLVVGSVAGAACGSTVAAAVSGALLRKIFGVLVLIIAVRLFVKEGGEGRKEPAGGFARFLVLGLVAGVVSAMMGIGGGVVMVPVMALLFGHPIHRSVGTSCMVIVFTSAAGAAGHVYHGLGASGLAAGSVGYVNLVFAALLVPTSMIGARYGAVVAARTQGERLRRYFSIFLVPVGLKMLGVF